MESCRETDSEAGGEQSSGQCMENEEDSEYGPPPHVAVWRVIKKVLRQQGKGKYEEKSQKRPEGR